VQSFHCVLCCCLIHEKSGLLVSVERYGMFHLKHNPNNKSSLVVQWLAYLPLDPRFVGSNLAEAVEF
jgi:hypothetical protein